MNPEKTTIQSIHARQIYDSRGNPTVEVDLKTELGLFRASVPSGASTGRYEAVELRDKDKSDHHGKSVHQAVKNVNTIIAPALLGMDPLEQEKIDMLMVEELDGTKTEWGWRKAKLGANAILAVSMAVCRAGAAASHLPLYEYISVLANCHSNNFYFPVPGFNIINGGAHSGSSLVVQEFMIFPTNANSFHEAMKVASEVYQSLKSLLVEQYGTNSINVGDEGGFAPDITNEENPRSIRSCVNSIYNALDLIEEAIKRAGYEGQVEVGMDVAASEFYVEDKKKYDLLKKCHDKKKDEEDGLLTAKELVEVYKDIQQKYPLYLIEDGFDQDDFDGWSALKNELGKKIFIVGDDLTVTNSARIQNAIDKNCCTTLLLKMNQTGSITESIQAVKTAESGNMDVMASHRSGETEDCFLTHLAIGLHARKIKSGAPCRSERLCKYNEFLRLEEELVSDSHNHVFYNMKPVENTF